ncbi:FMN-linked oxidoreductase [Lactarius hatsudake]|nr:FMN-linked oxidoreductase [Lactarius hatsudake]
MAAPVPKIFQPTQVGTTNLQHRVVLAPMKRTRADERNVLGELGLEYYKQRTSTPGTLAITEGTFIALHAGGCANVPGIWSDEQIAAWKSVRRYPPSLTFIEVVSLQITNAVHANGSFIYLQLWVLGRVAEGDVLRKAGGYEVVAPSPIALEGCETPRALTVAEIKEYVQLYATAAENAVLKAGFDGVEVLAAGGYLLAQFLQPASNTRTDEYGGSVENRLRFVLEVTDAVVKAVGANKVGIRISPYLKVQGMGMPDPIPTYTKLVTSIRDSYPDFAYLHVLEITDIVGTVTRPSTKFLRDIWGDRPYIANGAYERDTAIEVVEKEGGLVAFGRYFISNPDLPRRLKENIELALNDPKTWWAQGAEGYTDYPFAMEVKPGV